LAGSRNLERANELRGFDSYRQLHPSSAGAACESSFGNRKFFGASLAAGSTIGDVAQRGALKCLTRREFLARGGMFAGAWCAPHFLRLRNASSNALLRASSLEKFVDPLPIPPVAKPAGMHTSPVSSQSKLPYYRMPMQEMEAKLHRDLPPTRLWGVAGTFPGATLEMRTGQAVLVDWANELPHRHLLPIDHDVHGAGAKLPDVRAVMHLHGGRNPPQSDGYPEDWYLPGKSALYHYPNQQEAAMLWYHDHTLGITRLNVFAGLLGAAITRDDSEEALPLPRGKYEIPLIICDRTLNRDGQLTYPAKWVNEIEGDAILVNGKIAPYLQVEPRSYRFRVLNGANSRIFDFSLSNQQKFHQIGSDQGLLPSPVELETLMLAPGERADLVVDFAASAGTNLILLDDENIVMQFRVAKQSSNQENRALPKKLRDVPRIVESSAVKSRMLTLNDVIRNSDVPVAMLLNNTRWHEPVTEKPVLDSVEIWNLVNLVDETHPIHLHLVRFQVLDRRRFDVLSYQEKHVLKFSGPPIPPDPNELGWKDTVQAKQGVVTRIIARFEGYTGKFVWHCHILEHEDNEMMRPLIVMPE
jgi:spore coat protein A